MDKEKLIAVLKEENEHRWYPIAKSEYSCLTCSHAKSRGNDVIICLATEHKEVDDNHLCKDWNLMPVYDKEKVLEHFKNLNDHRANSIED